MYRRNTAGQFVCFQGVDATTGGIKSGVTWTMRRCLDGTFAAGGGTVTEDGTAGWYKCALAQADTNGNDCSFNFTGTGAVPQTINIVTTAADPTDGVHFGLTCLPNTAVTTNASLLTSGTGTDQVSVSGGKVLLQATQSGVTIPTVTTVTNQLTAAQVATGVWQDATAGDFTTASSIGKSLYTTGNAPGAASGLAIVGSAMTLAANQHVIVDSGTVTTVTNQLTGAAIATAVWQDTTSGDFTVASSIGKSLFTSGAVPGATGGLFIAGSNAATTISGLTTGALSCTTITASGAVAFQSTFAVTTSTSLAALSATTVTFSGAVAFQSTFAVTTSTSLAALSCTTLTASSAVAFQSTFGVTGTTTLAAVNTGAVGTGNVTIAGTLSTSGTATFNAFTITNAFTVSGATTLTGAVTGTNASNDLRVNTVAIAANVFPSVRNNTAVTGAATSITLDAGASASNNFYNNDLVVLTGGTGAGQSRFVTAYVGATKVATVATWVTNPDATTTFSIIPYDAVAGATAPTAAQVATAVWQDSTASDFTTASSIGKSLYNAFTANTSVYTVAALANAPTGGNAPTVSQIATAVWQDATAGDFTTAGSIGKSLFTGGNAPGAASGLSLVGSNMGAVTVSDKTGFSLVSTGLDLVLVDGKTLPRAVAITAGVVAGKISGAGTGTETFLGLDGSTVAATVSVDASGNRTAVTY